MFPFWAPGSDGWAAARGLGSHWAPFMFPFWAPGSDGWAAATGLGSHWAPFMFTLWAGRMGGPRQRGWASIELPSCFLSGLLGRMGDGAGLPLGSLHVSFLGSWVGWVGRGNGARLPLGSLHVSFRMGGPRHWAPFMFPFWAPWSDG